MEEYDITGQHELNAGFGPEVLDVYLNPDEMDGHIGEYQNRIQILMDSEKTLKGQLDFLCEIRSAIICANSFLAAVIIHNCFILILGLSTIERFCLSDV